MAVQSAELGAAAETDPSSAKASSPVALVAGQTDASLQLLDFSDPEVDNEIARELGEAHGERVDAQVINGSGVSGQTTGLLATAGIHNLALATGTPTVQSNLASIGKLVSNTAGAYGGPIPVILVHPRRAAFLRYKLTSDLSSLDRFVEVAAIPTTLGAGTEDTVIALEPRESPLFVTPVVFSAFPQVLSGNLAVRFQLRRYIALMASRKPASIGKLTGSELIAPPAVW